MFLLPVHIAAGALALASGAVAMAVSKGSLWHRKAGRIFVGSMWVMSALGAGIAVGSQAYVSVLAGLLTFYLVSTALLTVRHTLSQSRAWVVGFMVMALVLGLAAIGRGIVMLGEAGAIAALYFVFGTISLVAGLLDARLLRAGTIAGAHRIARHVWRMELAMFIAAASFFLGQAKQFPEPLRTSGLLCIPVIIVVLHCLYWLFRVLGRRHKAVTPR